MHFSNISLNFHFQEVLQLSVICSVMGFHLSTCKKLYFILVPGLDLYYHSQFPRDTTYLSFSILSPLFSLKVNILQVLHNFLYFPLVAFYLGRYLFIGLTKAQSKSIILSEKCSKHKFMAFSSFEVVTSQCHLFLMKNICILKVLYMELCLSSRRKAFTIHQRF